MPRSASAADLRPLYDAVLAPRLAALERDRLALKHAIVASALLVGLPIAMAFCGGGDLLALAAPAAAKPWIAPVSFVLIGVGTAIAVWRYALPGLTAYLNYRVRFKREVVSEIFRAVSPGAAYDPFSYIRPETFEQSGLFERQGEVRGDDLVRGRIGETPFEASEIDRHYSTGGEDSKTVSVFHGLFFCLDFNKTIHGRTIVQPRKAESIRLAPRRELTRVTLENTEFASQFDVFSTSPVEARYILTPVLMEHILAIHAKTARPLCLAFVDNRAFVAVDYGRSLFEPSIAETTSFEGLAEMAELFQLADLVVEELELNTRIWTKDVDARLLDEKPAVDPIATLGGGDVTPEQLLERASGQLFVDRDAGPAPERPARARARVERDGDETIVRYRVAWWAIVCLAISAALAAVAVSAAAMVIDPAWALEQLFPLLGVPPDAADVFRSGAPIAMGVSAIVGGFFALYWITYVRRVAIARDEIRVTRGLSPFARRYPRTAQTRILQMDRYLYLGKAGALKLINPSLSPMLRSGEEARWVAWEMRRALDALPLSSASPSA